jgi:type III secretion protein D
MTTPDAVTPGWCLRFLAGAMRGRTLALGAGANLLGSAPECQVMLPGSEVQARHLLVWVGELALTVQRAGDAPATLNGEELAGGRRALVAGDVVAIGSIAFQVERSYPASTHDDSMFAESLLPGQEGADAPAAPPTRPIGRWAGAATLVALALGLLAAGAHGGLGAPVRPAGPDLAAVRQVLDRGDEVEVVAQPGGAVAVRGYVPTRERQRALAQALAPFGHQVVLSVQPADEIVEQARRYVDVPGISVAYEGHGRLVFTGSTEDASVRARIARLADDLHPTVIVADHVNVLAPSKQAGDARLADQWAEWQKLLPARVVGITEDADGTRHIQLADGSRYYEGAVLRSGAELKHIDADGLELAGGAKAEPQR